LLRALSAELSLSAVPQRGSSGWRHDAATNHELLTVLALVGLIAAGKLDAKEVNG
jgi:hypothetical protein